MVSHPIKNLLKGLIDYAGLFPPARLDMATAVAAFARHRRSEHGWVLDRFIVPASRIGELEAALEGVPEDGESWPLSVLVGAEIEDQNAIQALEARQPGRLKICAVEAKVATPAEVARLASLFSGREIYCEIPLDDLRPWLEVLAIQGVRAKIRTGGITEDAFPAIRELASFLVATSTLRIPFKATAGLHHPLRGEFALTYEQNSPCATMHGFLNLFIGAALSWHEQIDEAGLIELLAERHTGAFDFQPAGVAWREARLTAEDIANARRHFALSYGSCSFVEPIADLRQLHLL